MGDFRNTPQGVGNLGFVETNGIEFGDIEYEGDADVFQTFLIAGLTYTIEQRGAPTAEGSQTDPFLFLVDVNNNTLAFDDDSGVGFNSLITYTAGSTGAHYLRAEGFAGFSTNDYTVSVGFGLGQNFGEVINGTSVADAVKAFGGNDTVRGLGGNDHLEGGNGNDSLLGGDGFDFLEGGQNNDILRGQSGDDVLRGGFQADILVGGTGNDLFQQINVTGSVPGARDTIRAGDGAVAFQGVGSAVGDKFDLSSIDANVTAGGDQAFIFGTATGKGRLWLSNSGSDTIIRGNIDNDAAAEIEIEIEDTSSVIAAQYTAADFFL